MRHVERTRLLVHLIDTSDTAEMDPVKAFEIIEGELRAFSEALADKPVIVVATKLDATTDRRKLEELRGFCEETELEFHAISAATGDGVKELVRGMADRLDRIPKEEVEDEAKKADEVKQVNGVEEGKKSDSSDENRAMGKRSSE